MVITTPRVRSSGGRCREARAREGADQYQSIMDVGAQSAVAVVRQVLRKDPAMETLY